MAPREYRRPSRRPLRVFALDPMRVDRGRAGRVTPRVTLYPPYEPVSPGPRGARIEVIDYDGAHACFYRPIDLDDRDVLIRDGLPPSETDPRFHQQMVYAVIANVWAAFETALGRRVALGRRKTLRVFPHAFYGENAYYDPDRGALMFGYFKASETAPGDNLPGQMVYTCLSHDVIVHEATHALVDRLRPYLMLDTNPDVLAFHEGFADLVAIFQHFTMNEVVEAAIADTHGEITDTDYLLRMARQFGYATGGGEALRTAEDDAPDPSRYRQSEEPHERGAVLVRAVFDAFVARYRERTADLLRLATGGSGVLPAGALHPDLVRRLAAEAAALANQFFAACLRAFDYLPPLDVTFEDFLRALVTADLALSPSDDSFRVAIIEGFRRHGIYPISAGSLGDEAVAWDSLPEPISGFPVEADALLDVLRDLEDPAYTNFELAETGTVTTASSPEVWRNWERRLLDFARVNHDSLRFPHADDIQVEGMHPTIRYRANGRPTVDLVVRFVQLRTDLERAGVVPRAGATVVASVVGAPPKVGPGDDEVVEPPVGHVRLVIHKPLPEGRSSAEIDSDAVRRLRALDERVDRLEQHEPGREYRPPVEAQDRLRISFARLHGTYREEAER